MICVNVKATLTQVRTCSGSKVACVCVDDDVVSGYKQKAATVQRNCAMNANKKKILKKTHTVDASVTHSA